MELVVHVLHSNLRLSIYMRSSVVEGVRRRIGDARPAELLLSEALVLRKSLRSVKRRINRQLIQILRHRRYWGLLRGKTRGIFSWNS